jgi:hypothetical protein
MLVKVGKLKVSVADRECPNRPCYHLGFDKGTFVQGRGYTKYHRDAKGNTVEYPICFTRHLHGCPINSICPGCHSASVSEPGKPCDSTWNRECKEILVATSKT